MPPRGKSRNHRERRKPANPAPPRKFQSHPLYGEIPLIPETFQDQAGRVHVFDRWDLSYEPRMPRGAVRGDVRKQNLCFACHTPMYFYVDQQKTCIQCGKDFVFGAAEQKFWYETLGFYGTSAPIRCRECRRRKRSEKSLNLQMAAAKSSLKQSPRDPALLMGLAEAIVLFHLQTGNGKLNEAITSARYARRIDPNAHEGMFWEACCHMISGRTEKARKLFLGYMKCSPRSNQQKRLKTKASAYLEQLGKPKASGK